MTTATLQIQKPKRHFYKDDNYRNTITTHERPGYTLYTTKKREGIVSHPLFNPSGSTTWVDSCSYVDIELPPQHQLITWTGYRHSQNYQVQFSLPMPWVHFYSELDRYIDIRPSSKNLKRANFTKYLFSPSGIQDTSQDQPIIMGSLPNVYPGGLICFGHNESAVRQFEDIVNIFYSSSFNRDMWYDTSRSPFWNKLSKISKIRRSHVLRLFEYWESLSLADVCELVADVHKESEASNLLGISINALYLNIDKGRTRNTPNPT